MTFQEFGPSAYARAGAIQAVPLWDQERLHLPPPFYQLLFQWFCSARSLKKKLFAKSYFVKQLRYKLFRCDRSCETLFRLIGVSDKWHFYEILDSFESTFA